MMHIDETKFVRMGFYAIIAKHPMPSFLERYILRKRPDGEFKKLLP